MSFAHRTISAIALFCFTLPCANAEILLKGVEQAEELKFSVHSTQEQTGKWISLGQSFAGFRAVAYDPQKEALTLESEGGTKVIYLQRAVIANQDDRAGQPPVPAPQSEEVRLRMIQIKRRENETDQQLLERANTTAIAKITAGVSFAEVAKEYSDDARKSKGGDWGLIKPSDVRPAFRDIIFALKTGQTSAPFISPEGCFIFFAEQTR